MAVSTWAIKHEEDVPWKQAGYAGREIPGPGDQAPSLVHSVLPSKCLMLQSQLFVAGADQAE